MHPEYNFSIDKNLRDQASKAHKKQRRNEHQIPWNIYIYH